MVVVTNIEYLVGDFARFEFEGLKADKKTGWKIYRKTNCDWQQVC